MSILFSMDLRQNLKKLSRGLNLRLGSNMVGSPSNFIQCFKIQAGAQLKPVFGGFEMRLKFINFGLRSENFCVVISKSYPAETTIILGSSIYNK